MEDGSRQHDGTVIIAMVAVRVVQVTSDEIIDVIAVRHCGVTAIGAVDVVFGVCSTIMRGSASNGIGTIDSERVLFDAGRGRVMQMAIVEIIHMPFVLDRDMATAWAVGVVVWFVMIVSHGHSPKFMCGIGQHSSISQIIGMGTAGFEFRRMGDSRPNQVGHMLIGQRIIDVVAISATLDQSFTAKNPKSL